MQQTGTGTGHWINMLVPKRVYKFAKSIRKLYNIGMEQSKIIDTIETYQHPQA